MTVSCRQQILTV